MLKLEQKVLRDQLRNSICRFLLFAFWIFYLYFFKLNMLKLFTHQLVFKPPILFICVILFHFHRIIFPIYHYINIILWIILNPLRLVTWPKGEKLPLTCLQYNIYYDFSKLPLWILSLIWIYILKWLLFNYKRMFPSWSNGLKVLTSTLVACLIAFYELLFDEYVYI